jgi:hypothetical protein
MKILRNLITVVLMASASVAVQAQDRSVLKANVPFAFTVENVDLPAGTYTVSTLPPYNMIKLESADGRNVAMIPVILATKSEDAKQTKMVFRQLGHEYFLTQVWEQGSSVHRDVRTGKRETRLAKYGDTPQFVTIVATAGNDSHS